jgi:hypothetical protein
MQIVQHAELPVVTAITYSSCKSAATQQQMLSSYSANSLTRRLTTAGSLRVSENALDVSENVASRPFAFHHTMNMLPVTATVTITTDTTITATCRHTGGGSIKL